MRGDRICLRETRETDLATLVQIRNDVALQRSLLTRVQGSSVDQVRDWIARRTGDRNTLFFIIADVETDETLGFIQIARIDPVDRCGELGICITSLHQGQGFGRDAILLMLGYAKQVFDLRKVVLHVLGENATAIELYASLGFERVGLHRDHFYSHGQFLDVWVMERLIDS